MKKLKKKTIRIIDGVATVVGIVSGSFTVLYNPMWNNIKVIFYICLIITLICIIIICVTFVYYGIAALQVYSSKKKEKIDFEAFKKSVEKVGRQYTGFQEYIKSMEQTIGDRIVCPACNPTFKYNSTDVTAETNWILSQLSNSEIHIICYGRNVYGEVIDFIRQKKLNVTIKIIVYDSRDYTKCKENEEDTRSSICNDGDDTRIINHITDILKDKVSAKVYVTKIPPSIRACVIYEKKLERLVPIWGTVQSYRFEKKTDGGFTIKKPDKSLIAICGKKTINEDFRGMVECFHEEFDYLQDACYEVKWINGKLEYKPYNKNEEGEEDDT